MLFKIWLFLAPSVNLNGIIGINGIQFFSSCNFTAALVVVKIRTIIPHLSQKIIRHLRIVYQKVILLLEKWPNFTQENRKLGLELEWESVVSALLFNNVKAWTEFCLHVLYYNFSIRETERSGASASAVLNMLMSRRWEWELP